MALHGRAFAALVATRRRIGWVCTCGQRLDDALACACGRRYRLVDETAGLAPVEPPTGDRA